MSKPFTVIPQRYGRDLGWYTCTADRATSWGVGMGSTVLVRFETKRAASAEAQRRNRLAKPARKFSFASLCPPRLPSRSLIATSLNHKPKDY